MKFKKEAGMNMKMLKGLAVFGVLMVVAGSLSADRRKSNQDTREIIRVGDRITLNVGNNFVIWTDPGDGIGLPIPDDDILTTMGGLNIVILSEDEWLTIMNDLGGIYFPSPEDPGLTFASDLEGIIGSINFTGTYGGSE
ncbi:MAG: hypothetical protein HY606_04335 [Planctomycetes bacterium]|nr:hypothetical protein [Planctomycetota bacterium]